ncbi:TPA: hypothetical protein V1U33_000230 [Streptococcus pneumoniae]|uniref:Uncharacterized protein n=1 Tax=Streptococcus pseudopneumoniae TaxID=257758 RepID=A0A3A4RWT9_9STRE|nr:hypothetical protein [Streptococcus pseudopneumoniae]RJP79325.1 hypothetical protein C5O68_09960 [Streptococcus pseudopneumoniae]HEX1942913.1 hypothetical protein [Streptococcus pneumoniae]
MDLFQELICLVQKTFYFFLAIYHVLLKQESYNPRLQGLTEIRNPDKTMFVQDAIRFAQQHGFNML